MPWLTCSTARFAQSECEFCVLEPKHSMSNDDTQGCAAAAAGVVCTAVQHESATPAATALCQVRMWCQVSLPHAWLSACSILTSSAMCPRQGKHTTFCSAAA